MLIVPSGHIREPVFGFIQRFLRFLTEIPRTVPVHIYLSHKCLQPGLFQQIHQLHRRRAVHSGEYAGPGRGAPLQVLCEDPVRASGIIRVFIPGFLRKCILFQPVQKFLIHPESAERILGCVDMQIRKPRGKCRPRSRPCTQDSCARRR